MLKKQISVSLMCLTIISLPTSVYAETANHINIQNFALIGAAMVQRSQSTYGINTASPTPPSEINNKPDPMRVCIETLNSMKKFHEIETKLLFRSYEFALRDLYSHKFENNGYFSNKDLKIIKEYNDAELKCFKDNINIIPGGYNEQEVNKLKDVYIDIFQLPHAEMNKSRHKVSIGEYNDLMMRIRNLWGELYITRSKSEEERKKKKGSAIGQFIFGFAGVESRVDAWSKRDKKP